MQDADLEPLRAEARREQGALTERLIAFARERFNQRDWDSGIARDLLIGYVEEFSARVFRATMGHEGIPVIGDTSPLEQYIVHRFVLHAIEEDQTSFEFLASLVKGKMLADAIFLEEANFEDEIASLANLEVYLDTPILLRILGYMGSELSAPYLELLELLSAQGALVRCFQSNMEEAERILRRAAKAAEPDSQDRLSGDLFRHFARIGATPSDIALLAKRLPTDLLQLKIQPIPLPQLSDRHVSGKHALERMLRREMQYRQRPLETDASALMAVYGIRERASGDTLARSKAVFITRNYQLHKVSSEFFQRKNPGQTVPICIPMSAFTTMVWVRQPFQAPDLAAHRIIADSAAAIRPSQELWRAFDAEIAKLQEDEDISADLAYHLRVDVESELALMDQTLGDENEYVEGTAKQVAERALENERVERAWREAKLDRNARRLGRFAARTLYCLVIPLLGIGAIFGTLGVLSNFQSPVPGVLQWAGTILFAAIGVLSLADGISFRSRAQRTAGWFESRAAKVARRAYGFHEKDAAMLYAAEAGWEP